MSDALTGSPDPICTLTGPPTESVPEQTEISTADPMAVPDGSTIVESPASVTSPAMDGYVEAEILSVPATERPPFTDNSPAPFSTSAFPLATVAPLFARALIVKVAPDAISTVAVPSTFTAEFRLKVKEASNLKRVEYPDAPSSTLRSVPSVL